MTSPSRKLVLADTGPLYAALDPSDQYHLRARTELEELAAAGWHVVISWTTIAEAYSLTTRWLGVPIAQMWLEDISDGATLIAPDTNDFLAAARHIQRFPDQRLTVFDAVVFAISQRLQAPVWTFDHHFDVMGAGRWYPR